MLARRALPALILSVLALAFAAPASASASAACSGANRHLDAAHVPGAARATLCLLNVQRAHHGLRPLRASGVLARPAARHSRDMVRERFFAHGAFLSRLRTYTAPARVWRVGENLAWGGGRVATPSSIVAMWMRSPSHRGHILTGAFREIGIGVAPGTPTGVGGGTWTTDFGMRR